MSPMSPIIIYKRYLLFIYTRTRRWYYIRIIIQIFFIGDMVFGDIECHYIKFLGGVFHSWTFRKEKSRKNSVRK